MNKIAKPIAVVAATASFLCLMASPGLGEVSVRECIQLRGGSEGLIRLPAATSSNLLTMAFNLLSPSDAIFDVAIIDQDSNTPLRTPSRYNLLIDGTSAYRVDNGKEYFFRTPIHTQDTIDLRFHFAGIPAGNHVATLYVNNTSASPIDVAGVYMTPLFVDATEATSVYDVTGSRAIGSGWTVLGQLTSPSLSNRHLHLSSYIKASNAGHVQFAYNVNGVVLDAIDKNFENLDDGFVYQFTIENASPNSVVQLVAQGPATIITTEMTAQTLEPYTVYEGYLPPSSISVPNDTTFHTVFSSNPTTLNQYSLAGPQCCVPDHHQVCFWGHGWLELNMAASAETSIQFYHYGTSPNYSFEAGNLGHSADTQLSSYANPTDLVCGSGFYGPPVQYGINVQISGWCPANGPITASKGRVQVIVVPAPVLVQFPTPGYDQHTCTTSWAPACTYQCALNSSLQIVTAPPQKQCN
jgi:hypothetical protein